MIQLKSLTARFPTNRAFIEAFNAAAGFEALDETVLSRQLSGKRNLSKAWKAAYKLFEMVLNAE